MRNRQRATPLRLLRRGVLLSAAMATLTFVIAWITRHSSGDLLFIPSLIVISTFGMYAVLIPVNLLLLLCTILLRRFVPGMATAPLWTMVLLALVGAGAAAGIVALALRSIDPESEFLQMALLACIVGGIVAGWVMTDGVVRKGIEPNHA